MEKEKPIDKHRRLVAEADHALAEIDEALEAEQLFFNWVTHGRSVVTEADITIEGDPNQVVHDPNQGTLFD